MTHSKYVAGYWDTMAKAKQLDEHFPIDCKKAFEMGVRFVKTTWLYRSVHCGY